MPDEKGLPDESRPGGLHSGQKATGTGNGSSDGAEATSGSDSVVAALRDALAHGEEAGPRPQASSQPDAPPRQQQDDSSPQGPIFLRGRLERLIPQRVGALGKAEKPGGSSSRRVWDGHRLPPAGQRGRPLRVLSGRHPAARDQHGARPCPDPRRADRPAGRPPGGGRAAIGRGGPEPGSRAAAAGRPLRGRPLRYRRRPDGERGPDHRALQRDGGQHPKRGAAGVFCGPGEQSAGHPGVRGHQHRTAGTARRDPAGGRGAEPATEPGQWVRRSTISSSSWRPAFGISTTRRRRWTFAARRRK